MNIDRRIIWINPKAFGIIETSLETGDINTQRRTKIKKESQTNRPQFYRQSFTFAYMSEMYTNIISMYNSN